MNQTGIIILQHPRERFHAIGTVRIARLALANVRVDPCTPWADATTIRAQLPRRAALLFPAEGARELATLPVEERPQHLVILDGTWFHAKKIYGAHQWLRELPRVSVTPNEPSRYRIRPEPNDRYVATVEAIVYALRIIEPQTRGLESLLRTFAAMVDRQAAYTPDLASAPHHTALKEPPRGILSHELTRHADRVAPPSTLSPSARRACARG